MHLILGLAGGVCGTVIFSGENFSVRNSFFRHQLGPFLCNDVVMVKAGTLHASAV